MFDLSATKMNENITHTVFYHILHIIYEKNI